MENKQQANLIKNSALGNLTRQTDTRGQRICLYYDPLNRLLGKHYRLDDNCPSNPTYNVSYGYDSGTNGIGQRTSMTDTSGSTSWTYTARGLLESETKTITGAGTFATQYTYNSADLPTNMQYPADNAGNLTGLPSLTYTYHLQLTLNTLGSYVTGTTYDAAGGLPSAAWGMAQRAPTLTTPGQPRADVFPTSPRSNPVPPART